MYKHHSCLSLILLVAYSNVRHATFSTQYDRRCIYFNMMLDEMNYGLLYESTITFVFRRQGYNIPSLRLTLQTGIYNPSIASQCIRCSYIGTYATLKHPPKHRCYTVHMP